jgi:hypothetical protein
MDFVGPHENNCQSTRVCADLPNWKKVGRYTTCLDFLSPLILVGVVISYAVAAVRMQQRVYMV